MLKFVNTGVVFQEIPEETTLAINLSNCPCHCPGCHSHYLWDDIGTVLDEAELDRLVSKYGADVTCVCFMGGDAEPQSVNGLAAYVHRKFPKLKVGWYSGRTILSGLVDKSNFNYIKIGPYIRHLGPLNSKTTNQRLYQVMPDGSLNDITGKFWKRHQD